jgi:hypothetical protein
MDTERVEDLAALFQRTSPHGRRVDCPTADRLWAATSGELSSTDARAVVDHSVRCGDCSEALRVARELRVTAVPTDKASPERWSPQPKWLIGLALAAGLAGVVVVSGKQDRALPGAVAERGAEGPSLHSALSHAPQSRTALVLRWVPYPHARRYDVTLATTDLRVLFQRAGVESAEVAVPAAALATVSPGTHLVWRVEATLEDGQSVESPAFSLDLD